MTVSVGVGMAAGALLQADSKVSSILTMIREGIVTRERIDFFIEFLFC
jgi:hypothetical protein